MLLTDGLNANGLQVRQPGAFPQQAVLPQEAGDQLLTWEQVGQQAGEDVLQGYQLLPEGMGGPRAASSRVLPTDKDARTDKAVLLYRDTDGWCGELSLSYQIVCALSGCPSCQMRRWSLSMSTTLFSQPVHFLQVPFL